MNPRPKTVEACPDHTLLIEFDNGERKRYDVKPLLDFPVFKPLRDYPFFQAVHTDGFCVYWNDEVDLCPDTVYEKGVPLSR